MRLLLPLLLVLVWAGIYLPGLGDVEIKGEETRRILPGVRMVETGDYLRVYVGARPYLRKPPLINWAVAGAMNLTGHYNEWVVRLPSTLAVLALGLTMFFAGRTWLGENAAWLASIFLLTNISLMEKGRLAEIEPHYVSLFGIAMILWLVAQGRRAGGWTLWLPAGLFLGLAMLAKGPLHLLFFYAIVAGVLWKTSELRRFLHPAFWLSLVLVLGPFLVWTQLFKAAMPAEIAESASGVWVQQLTSRLGFDDFVFADWLLNIPRSILNVLPWCVFFPLLWSSDLLAKLAERDRLMLLGARPAMVITFILISLLPGSLERYTLPLLVPVLLFTAMVVVQLTPGDLWTRAWVLSNEVIIGIALFVGVVGALYFGGDVNAWAWIASGFLLIVWIALSNKLVPKTHPATQAGFTALSCVGIAMLYASLAPFLAKLDNARPMASEIRQSVPPDVPLLVQDSGFRQFWFYLEPEAEFFWRARDFPNDSPDVAVLLPEGKAEEFLNSSALQAESREMLLETQDRRGDSYQLWLLKR